MITSDSNRKNYISISKLHEINSVMKIQLIRLTPDIFLNKNLCKDYPNLFSIKLQTSEKGFKTASTLEVAT